MKLADIVDKARAITGLSDLGDPAVLEGLEILVRASNEEAHLSDTGAPRWEANLVSFLSNRLRILDHLKEHPELLERPTAAAPWLRRAGTRPGRPGWCRNTR